MIPNRPVNRSASPSMAPRTPAQTRPPADASSPPTARVRTPIEGPPTTGAPRVSAARTSNVRASLEVAPATAVAPAAPQEATAAGHAESFCRLGGGHIAKMTSAAEAQMYERHGQQLEGVIPGTVSLDHAGALPGVTPEQLASLTKLRETAQASGQHVVIMETVGGNIPKAHKREMDAKLGSRTASRTGLIDEGATPSAALRKKLKMSGADYARGAWQVFGENRGYSLTGRTIGGANPDSSRFSAGRHSQANIAETFDLPDGHGPAAAARVLQDLQRIRTRMQETPVTFVASSVLMALDEQHPENSAARLIGSGPPGGAGSGFDRL